VIVAGNYELLKENGTAVPLYLSRKRIGICPNLEMVAPILMDKVPIFNDYCFFIVEAIPPDTYSL
jgi:hypothetical protein